MLNLNPFLHDGLDFTKIYFQLFALAAIVVVAVVVVVVVDELPLSLQELTDTCLFKKQLINTHLFTLAYNCLADNFVEAPLVTLGVNMACEMTIM